MTLFLLLVLVTTFALLNRLAGSGLLHGARLWAGAGVTIVMLGTGLVLDRIVLVWLGPIWFLWRSTPKFPVPGARLDPGTPVEGLLLFLRHITLMLPGLLLVAWFAPAPLGLVALLVLVWACVTTGLGFVIRETKAQGLDFIPWAELLGGAVLGAVVWAGFVSA